MAVQGPIVKQTVVLCLLVLRCSRGGQSTGTSQNATDLLKKVSDDYWNWRLQEYPQIATQRGLHEYDDRMDEFTMEAFKRQKGQIQKFLDTLRGLDTSGLAALEFENYEVLEAELEQFAEGYEFRNYGQLNPINFLEGVHRSTSWIRMALYYSEEDFKKYEKRLEGLANQINQLISLMKEAIRLRRTNHAVSMTGVTDQIANVIRPANYSRYFWPYIFKLESTKIPQDIRIQIRERGVNLIETKVNPAFNRLKEFIQTTYMNNTREEYGVGSFEFGQEYYQACLKFHLSADVTAREVHNIGLREVRRIGLLMKQIMKENNFAGSIPQFVSYLQTQRTAQFYNRSADHLLREYKHIIEKRIQPKLKYVVKTVPDIPIQVLAMPDDGPSGSYGSNTFWVNVFQPHKRPIYTMMALSLHEANPGHHLQTVVARQLPLPNFRRYSMSSRYYAAPFNFPWYTAYTEGWALYSEFLGEEMNLYNRSALELFGRYSSEIFRAGRLVVDTGIHAFGKSRSWAIEYLANYTAMPRSQIETEVNRYITWPGQACAYKMGELEIKRIRQKAKDALGDKFDVQHFNDIVLRIGRSPMSVVERAIDRFISANRPEASMSPYSPNRAQHIYTSVSVLLTSCVVSLISTYLRLGS